MTHAELHEFKELLEAYAIAVQAATKEGQRGHLSVEALDTVRLAKENLICFASPLVMPTLPTYHSVTLPPAPNQTNTLRHIPA